jgi:hypothetical protein
MNVHARFAAYEAKEARDEAPVPLLVGLTGPSGSGKTFSALRIATGIQSVVGGDIFVVDTEQRRALHYADRFDFKHVNFEAPFGSLDYLEALRFCKSSGAGVVVIDSCSHEHDGPGGLLEQHEAELDRMAGNDFKKRDRMQMLAWQKPKAGRRKLINAITTELNMPVIFCFRAKKTTKPKPGAQPIDMGFTSIGADEWLFEMALNALLLPGCRGVPTWQSDMPGEALAIKLPEQFAGLAGRNRALDENVGAHLAKWATGKLGEGAKREKIEDAPRRFQAEKAPSGDDMFDDGPNDPREPDDAPEPSVNDDADSDWRAKADEFLASIKAARKASYLDAITDDYREVAAEMPKPLADEVEGALAAKRGELSGG